MRAYVVDAFSRAVFGGNQAGVVLPDRELDDALMRRIAAEFKHSETAFVAVEPDQAVRIRYFTPSEEVDLCGHATIAGFSLLRQIGLLGEGKHLARTRSGDLRVDIEGDTVWMDMAQPKRLHTMDESEARALYEAFGLTTENGIAGFAPEIVSTGLADIMLPVRDRGALMAARQNESLVAELSRRYDCVGVHMFCLGDSSCTARCSNFAPRYGIPEECATGTANGALTYYLYRRGLVTPGQECLFVQGEHMGRPSQVHSRLIETDGGVMIRIGGGAVVSMRCEIMI